MKTELIRTLRVAYKNEYQKKTEKELSILLIDDCNNELLKELIGYNYLLFNSYSLSHNDMNSIVAGGSIYILKNENDNEVYGVAFIISDTNNPISCYLYDFVVKTSHNSAELELWFLKSISENIKNKGFVEMILNIDIDNISSIRSCLEEIGLKVLELRSNEYNLEHLPL